ncbi:MAG TPA: cytochrome c oxidase assembly protein [Stellaceae bacterium]|nr:cytochrome c oxidase assembly protein [Stellaceae bacterium]
MASDRRRRNRITVLALLGVVGIMVGLDIASVPLYRLFCAVTGYNGTTQRAAEGPARELENRLVTVRFDANIAPDLGWEFRPLVNSVQVHPGEERTVAYRAVNKSRKGVTGTATYNVTPGKVGLYFDKIQCFCFTRQHLDSGESKDLTVTFFVDPDIASDPNTRDVDTITLSYSMFRAKDQDTPASENNAVARPSVAAASSRPPVNPQ